MFLNCDMGESFGQWQLGCDEKIMPYIDMANIACGFHASDPLTMQKTVQLALQHNVKIGAHPSYPDLVGFGRRHMTCSSDEIYAFVSYQIGALAAFCKQNNHTLSYVKPHGALYNDMMRDANILNAILRAIADYDNSLTLVLLATSHNAYFQSIADNYHISLIFEAFSDRRYTDLGELQPRHEEGAVLHESGDVVTQISSLIKHGHVITNSGNILPIEADTICVHGDSQSALNAVLAISKQLK